MRRVVLVILLMLWSFTVNAQDQTISGNITSTTCPGTGCVTLTLTGGGTGSITIEGTFGETLQFEARSDPAASWQSLSTNFNGIFFTSTSGTGLYIFNAGGLNQIRVRASSYTSGTATVRIRVTAQGLPQTLNLSGSISATQGTIPWTSTFVDNFSGNPASIVTSAPGATDAGLITRNIPSGTQPVSATSLPLPTGASTSANQTTGNTSLSSIDTKTPSLISGRVPVDGSGVTQPVSQSNALNLRVAGGGQFAIGQSVSVTPCSDCVYSNAQVVSSFGPVQPNAPVGGGNDSITTNSYTRTWTGLVGPRVHVQITGTFAGANISFWYAKPGGATQDDQPMLMKRIDTGDISATTGLISSGQSGGPSPLLFYEGYMPLTGGWFKITSTALTSGSVSYQITNDSLPSHTIADPVTVTSALPTGTNAIGSVTNTSFGVTNWIGSTAPSVGQKTMANSIPVALASDQSPPTVNLGTLNGVALDVTLTGGTQKAIIRGGVKGGTPAADVTSTAAGNNHQAVDVTIYAGNGVVVDPTVIRALTSADVVDVSDRSGRSLGTIANTAFTANAGTNLNTSALALDATLTGRTQKSQVTDGTRDGTIKAASTLPIATDTAIVTTQRDPLPAGTNVIGHTINDSGSTTAVTGNVTAVQATGSNLHMVADTGSTTAVTQATGTNLHAVIDSGSTTAVTQATGTNLHTVVDSGAITATQGTAAATASAWPIKITDATNTAAVKAASTAAVAADPSLVVGLSPNSPIPTGSNTIGALTANQSVNQTQMNGVAVSTGLGVSDTGTQRMTLSQESTYAASTTAKTATAAGTAAFFEICGSASKIVRIQRIAITGTVATAAVYGDIQLRKVSSVGTGNTATTLTNTPFDSNNAAATATVKYNTVLPTGGNTLVGNIFSETAFFPITGTVASMTPQFIYVWRDTDAEPPTLRGTTQCVTAGFGTTTTNAPTLSVSVAWTEK